jgi:hypothetical protein
MSGFGTNRTKRAAEEDGGLNHGACHSGAVTPRSTDGWQFSGDAVRFCGADSGRGAQGT